MGERKRRSVLQSARADGDGMRRPPGHLITGAGREEVMRKGGGEEARSVRCMCDVHSISAAFESPWNHFGDAWCKHDFDFCW